MVRGPERHEEAELAVEVAGLVVADAQVVLDELAVLRSELNVYRGQGREEVVLSESVLRRIERQTIDIARHRVQLQAAGQHLKRGLLLYGPPGWSRRAPLATPADGGLPFDEHAFMLDDEWGALDKNCCQWQSRGHAGRRSHRERTGCCRGA